MNKKIVNLKKLYPEHYRTDKYIELDDEIFDVIDKYEHMSSAYERKINYHKAYYSIDKTLFIEIHAVNFNIKDTIYKDKIIHEELLKLIMESIKNLSQIQRKRIIKRYIENKTLKEIAKEEDCSIQAVYYTIYIALNKIKILLLEKGYDVNDWKVN